LTLLFLYIGIKETYIVMIIQFEKLIDKSGKMFRYKYLEKYHIDILNNIIKYSSNNKLLDLPFKQQVYNWYKNIKPKLCYCGKPTKFKNSTLGYYEYCSFCCMNNSDKVKDKRKNTNIEKFGTKTPSENNDIKNKIINTNNKRYGANSPLINENIKDKSINTLMKNYGVDNPNKSTIIKEKIKKTNIERYGFENVYQNEKIRNKKFDTMIKIYGTKYAMRNEEIKNKMKLNLIDTLNKKLLKYYNNYNIIDIDNKNKVYKMMCDKEHVFDITYVLLNSRRRTNTVICTKCNPINKQISGLEIQLQNFINENYNEKIIINDRHLGKELDIYIPELKLAFEFNGLHWHNEKYRSKNYHLDKTEECEKNNIQLIHIWEDDWIYKQDIVKSMILNKLGKTPNRIYARKTEIKEITDNNSIRKFLDKNHIQGFVGSKVKLGLFYENKLVSLMTFGKNRNFMSNINDNGYELLRFCNILNTNVVGGASKLFKYFINNYDFNNIITYADKTYSNGNLYNNLNFKYMSTSLPSYSYVIDNIRSHRFNFRKHKLIKQGFDKNKSEHQIMLDRNIYRIYNSGMKRYKFIKNE